MVFWIIIALLTAGAVLAAFWPMFRAAKLAPGKASRAAEYEHDIAVYKDQLSELDADLKRGVISDIDAGQARVEIVRRLLAAQDKRDANLTELQAERERIVSGRILTAVALVFVPGLAVLVYTSLGSPSIEARPLAARLEAIRAAGTESSEENAQLQQLVARAEAHLEANPEDGRGWDVLAPVYFRLGDGARSLDAYRNAVRILGESAPRLAGMGEVSVALAGGVVTADAEALFERALAIEAANGRALYYTGLGEAQAGRPDDAARQWRKIVDNETIDANWRIVAAESMSRLAGANAGPDAQIDSSAAPMPGLDRQSVEAAEQMDDTDRQEMIIGMVEQLDERLKNGGGSVEEWQRLIRARMVLDQRDEAVAVLERASEVFANEPGKLEQVRSFADELGLSQTR